MLVVIAAAALVSIAPGPADARADGSDHLLHATTGAGARIVDDLGRTVILRGVNDNQLGEYYQDIPSLPSTIPLTEADFAQMAANGFDVVRLIISWSRLEPTPGAVDAAYLDDIAQAMQWARIHDIGVLLDMHQDAWGPWVGTPDGVTCPSPLEAGVGWDGAPQWATALVGTVATCRAPTGREFSLSVQTSFEDFYLDVGGVQSHLVATWRAMAARIAGEPNLVGYDLLNEPNPGLTIGVSDYALLGVYYARAIAAIRDGEASVAAPRHMVFFEPSVLTGPLPVPGPIPGLASDDDLVYAPHLYNGSISPLPGTVADGFANAATAAATYGTPFFSGEWGWFGDPTTDAPSIATYAALEDQYRVGGTWWQWKQACGDPHAIGLRGVRPACADRGSPYSDGLVTRPESNTSILSRAYPRAAPGVLQSVAADVTAGTLTITGTADRAGVDADLWVPARCATPSVGGTNVGASTVRAVDGGWRVTVTVPAAEGYSISVTCTVAAASGAANAGGDGGRGGVLPATGGDDGLAVPAALVALALAVRAGGRRGRRWRGHAGRARPAGARRSR